MNDTAFFQFSTEEDLSFVLEFSGLVLTGRSFEVKVKDRASDTTRATLTNGNGLTVSSAIKLEAAYGRTGMATWPRGEYSADVVDITGGTRARIMAVRFVLDAPGRLVQGVRDRKAYISWSPNQAVVTATGAIGPAGPQGLQGVQGAKGDKGDTGNTGATGPANTLGIGTVTNGAPGSAAAAITGAAPNQTLSLTLPQGLPGNGGNTSEILAAAGVTEQPNLIVDFARGEYFARRTGTALSLTALISAIGGAGSFSRASAAWYFDSDGLYKQAAINAPRIEYDPVTRACKGLLVEGQRTNALTYSDELDQAVYSKTRATVTPNGAIGITGAATMDKIVEDSTASNTHFILRGSIAKTAGTTDTASVVLRAAERTRGSLRLQGSAGQCIANFDLAAGTVAGLNSGAGTGTVAEIRDLGGGLFRVAVSGMAGASDATVAVGLYLADGTGAVTYSGDGASGFFAGSLQLELNAAAPSSIIPTGASTVTRSADIPRLGTGNWHSAAVGAFLVCGSGLSAFPSFSFSLSDGTFNNYIASTASASSATVQIQSGGVSQTVMSQNRGAAFRHAFRYKLDNIATSVDGAAVSLDTTATIPAGLDRLYIGVGPSGASNFVGGYIERIVQFPADLSDAKVRSLSGIAWPTTIISPPAVSVGVKDGITVVDQNTWVVTDGTIGDAKAATPSTPAQGIQSTKISFQQAGTSPVWRYARDKMRERVSVLDFGADLTGAADAATAFNRALATGADVVVPNGTYGLASTVRVPARQALLLDGASVIKPLANVDLLRASQSCSILGGTIDVTGYGGWNKSALLIDGSDYTSDGFWLHDLTKIQMNLKGGIGVNTGTAVHFNAASTSTARIMGIDVDVRVWGFELACYLNVGNNPGSNFITSNRIKVMSSASWRALYCVDPGLYDIAGNEISIHHQPQPGVTVPSVDFIGQMNDLFLLPWDWQTVAGTAPFAINLKSGARFNNIRAPIDPVYVNDSSGQLSNSFSTSGLLALAGPVRVAGPLYPSDVNGGFQTSAAIYGGPSVPNNALGNNGDFYFRSTGGAGSCIYQKRAGTWYAAA